MHRLSYLLALAAISGLAISAGPVSASLLTTKLTGVNARVPEVSDGLVQKVHGWHCGRKSSKRLGRHRHREACQDNVYSYGYSGYSYSYGYPRYDFAPSFSFGYSDTGDYHFRRHHRHHGGGHYRGRHHRWYHRR